MSDFAMYMLAQERRNAAMEGYNYAGARLTNAQIHERLAELKSQWDPLATLMHENGFDDTDKKLREILYAAAFYVVVGRMPG